MKKQKTAIIIGAGPAGLTAAYELLQKTDIKPIVFEATSDIGGISKTVNYKGNRIDLGGHRFFSKSDRVMKWWFDLFPLEEKGAKGDRVMLTRTRLSRIFYLRKFFDYPVTLSLKTLKNLGLWRTLKIGASYTHARLFPIKNEKSLEDFFINRFGRELYLTFFKDYTEKVWGIPCNELSAEWGAQRVKGVSIAEVIKHALKDVFFKQSLDQKKVETSLIHKFYYPKYGPGQLWEYVAELVKQKGGEVYLNHKVLGLKKENKKITRVIVLNLKDNSKKEYQANFVFSTMPVKELISAIEDKVPQEVKKVASGLLYRDFMTVGLLVNKLKIAPKIPDTWIYMQERDVKLGRIQIFNNWSPYLVKNQDKIWLGLEYFCNEGDKLWRMQDNEMMKFASEELAQVGFIDEKEVVDATVLRMPKTYPVYHGEYERFDIVRQYTDEIENLFLIGRNGMHRYNNQDHSMLTAMEAVENIMKGRKDKNNIWQVNAEKEYHEEKK